MTQPFVKVWYPYKKSHQDFININLFLTRLRGYINLVN